MPDRVLRAHQAVSGPISSMCEDHSHPGCHGDCLLPHLTPRREFADWSAPMIPRCSPRPADHMSITEPLIVFKDLSHGDAVDLEPCQSRRIALGAAFTGVPHVSDDTQLDRHSNT